MEQVTEAPGNFQSKACVEETANPRLQLIVIMQENQAQRELISDLSQEASNSDFERIS